MADYKLLNSDIEIIADASGNIPNNQYFIANLGTNSDKTSYKFKNNPNISLKMQKGFVTVNVTYGRNNNSVSNPLQIIVQENTAISAREETIYLLNDENVRSVSNLKIKQKGAIEYGELIISLTYDTNISWDDNNTHSPTLVVQQNINDNGEKSVITLSASELTSVKYSTTNSDIISINIDNGDVTFINYPGDAERNATITVLVTSIYGNKTGTSSFTISQELIEYKYHDLEITKFTYGIVSVNCEGTSSAMLPTIEYSYTLETITGETSVKTPNQHTGAKCTYEYINGALGNSKNKCDKNNGALTIYELGNDNFSDTIIGSVIVKVEIGGLTATSQYDVKQSGHQKNTEFTELYTTLSYNNGNNISANLTSELTLTPTVTSKYTKNIYKVCADSKTLISSNEYTYATTPSNFTLEYTKSNNIGTLNTTTGIYKISESNTSTLERDITDITLKVILNDIDANEQTTSAVYTIKQDGNDPVLPPEDNLHPVFLIYI